MSRSVLALNTGNTRTAAALFPESGSPRFDSFAHDSLSRLPEWASLPDAEVTIVSVSVNPSAETRALRLFPTVPSERVVRVGVDLPIDIPNRTEQPESVGLDRLLNAREAHRRFGASIVVDLGTAITLDVINEDGEFLGGVIAPGIGTGARALHEYTARLPQARPARLPEPLGRTTEQAIQSGLYWMAVGGIRLLIEKLSAELAAQPTIVATGGDAYLVLPAIPEIDRVHPHLTLEATLRLFEDLYGRF
ncbi:MAG: type III pantothenate kinase [Planctomycetota bacterium]